MNRLTWKLFALCLIALGSASAARAQDNEFWTEFKPAIRLADTDTMVKVTRRLQLQAVDTFVYKLNGKHMLTEVPEELETEIRYMKEAWQRAVGDDVFVNYEKLLAGMSAEQRDQRNKASVALRNESLQQFNRLQKTPDPAGYPPLLKSFETNVKALEALGDHYWSSTGYYWWGVTMDGARKVEAGGSIEEAIALFQKAKELRKSFGVNDGVIRDCDKEIEKLEKENAPDPAGGTPGEATGPKFVSGSKWIKVDLQPEAVAKLEAITWPGHLSDDRIPDWIAYSAKGPDAKGDPIGWFGSGDAKRPIVFREGATKFLFDMDDDGTYDGDFKLGGKPTLVEVQRTVGGEKQPYWFWVGFGSSQEQVQGLGMNMAPSDKLANMYFRSGMSRVGTLMDEATGVDVDVVFFDENVSGEIGDDRSFNISGTRRGETQLPCPLYDSMIIGKGRRAVPYSSLIVLDGKVFRLKFSNEKQDGVTLRQLDMGVGRAEVAVDGLKIPLASFIVEGDGDAKGGYFDLAAEKKGVELPVGTYKLAIATFRAGKGAQTQKVAAIAGTMPTFEVKAGETTKVQIGKPFSFDFEAKDTGAVIEIPGDSIVVKGGAGEIYFRYQGEMIRPEVASRKKGSSSKPGKGEEMKLCDDETLRKANGQEVAWHPLDYTFAKPGGKGEFEVHLGQKGHKWFGNLDSEWKPK